MRHHFVILVLIAAVVDLAAVPATAQTYCQQLAAQAADYQDQMRRTGRTAQDMQRRISELPADKIALSIWSPRTLDSTIDYVARNLRQDPTSLQIAVLRACEAQAPEWAHVTVPGRQQFCGDLSNRAYEVSLDRDGGVALDSALAASDLRTRPELRDDVDAVIRMTYDAPRRTPPQVAMDALTHCMRAEDVVVR